MKKYRWFIISVLIILDQIVKYLIRSNMNVGESVDVISTFFSITYIRNFGAAFGSMVGQVFVLKFAPIILVIGISICMEKMIKAHWSLILSFILVISGGIGNLIDRWFLGYVTDMFDFHFWPVFNVADICVCVGCGFLLLYVLIFERHNNDGREN